MIRSSIRLVLASVAVLAFSGFQHTFAQTTTGTGSQVVDPAAYDHPVRVACLGDSITKGEGTMKPAEEGYPAQLQTILGPKWEVTNYGVGGRTVLRKVDPYAIGGALKANPDVVIILLGTNDSRQKTWDTFGEDFVPDYAGIVEAFKNIDSHPKIWICYPTPMFPGRWDLSEDILTSKTIPAIKAVSEKTGVPVIDLHTPFTDEKDSFRDTVHPNAVVAHRIAEIVATALTGSAQPAK